MRSNSKIIFDILSNGKERYLNLNSGVITAEFYMQDIYSYTHPTFNISHVNYYGQHFTHYTDITTTELRNKFNNYLDRFFDLLNSSKKVLFIHSNEEFIYHKLSRDNRLELYKYLCKINDLLEDKYPNLKFAIINIDVGNVFENYKNVTNLNMEYTLPFSDKCEYHIPEYYDVYRNNITVIIKQYLKEKEHSLMTENIPLFKVFMSPEISKPITDTLLSGFITQGPKVEEFEDKLKEYFGHPWILTLNSATSGLILAVRLLKDQLGMTSEDEVLCTALTCTATNWPVLANNLRIKWVDADPETCNIDLADLKNKLTPNTKLILFVHWAGYPVDLDSVKEIQDYAQEKFGFRPLVIEDCAHAFGAKYKDGFLGTHGNIAVYSLQAIKHLTCGDGGLVFLPNKELYEKAKLLRWFGIDREKRSGGGDFRLEPDIPDWGYKFHMNDINATIGLENLRYIDNNLGIIRENANYYFKELDGVVGLPQNLPDRVGSWWIFTIKVRDKQAFITGMKDRGVTVSQVHGRNDIHSCVKAFKSNLPKLEKLENSIVSIPVGWWVTEKDREYICKCIKEIS